MKNTLILLRNTFIENKKGFILLFTIVIISITVGLSVAMIISSTRQTQLGSIQSEAQSAFFAADSGYECALAHIYSYSEATEPPAFKCGTASYPDNASEAVGEYNFDFRDWDVPTGLGATSSACGFVKIRRSQTFYVIEDGLSVEKTGDTIESFGYNLCTLNSTINVLVPDSSNPNLIERKIVVKIANDGNFGDGGDEGGDSGDDGGGPAPVPDSGGGSEGDPDNGGGPVGGGGGN